MNNRKRTRGRKFKYVTSVVKGEKPTRVIKYFRGPKVSERRAMIFKLTAKASFIHSREVPNPFYTSTRKVEADL